MSLTICYAVPSHSSCIFLLVFVMSVQLGSAGAVDLASHNTEGPTVVVAIVNYCTPQLTVDCLRSLQDELRDHPGSIAVVADNASPDGSGQLISRAITDNGWGAWAKVIQLPRNGGFAYGNNAIIREALGSTDVPRYVWLLNSDTIVRPGALRALVDFLDDRPEIGIGGSCLEDPDGTQQCSAFRFHSLTSEFTASVRLGPISRALERWAVAPTPNRVTAPYDWLSGASLLVRTEVLRSVGLLDEHYFLYYEETDFCRKVCAAGWQRWFVGDSRVVHLVGNSTGVTSRTASTRRRSAYWFESRRYYFIKNHGRLYAIAADMALALAVSLERLRGLVDRRAAAQPEHFLADLLRNSALFNSSKKATGG